MIDEDITFMEKGYRSTDLSKGSHKEVFAVCEGENCEREGGMGRWVQKRQYRDLCHKCAIKKPKIQKYETPTEKLYYIDDEITFIEKGYRSTDLKPNSHKEVWAICQGENCEREGGRGRLVRFQDCREMCQLCAHKTDEIRRKQSENHVDISGDKNGNWNGGSSFEPYCHKFNKKFKESIRDKFDRECFLCEMDEEENGRKLCVHHVSYDKNCMCDGKECEFVPLCNKCHSLTNHNREMWRRMILNQLALEGWI